MYRPNGKGDQAGLGAQGNAFSRPHLGTVSVIFADLGRTSSYPSRVIFVARLPIEDSIPESKRVRVENRPTISFSEEEKVGTIQSHDDALVITLRIERYDVKRVMVDQGSRVEIMYPDLYNGLGLKPKDLTAYDSPLVSFDGKVVIPKG